MRFFISGAAALNRDIAEWFHAAGILILEGYGLTEPSAGSFVNHPDDYQFGTVGPVFPGSEVKLGEGDEVLIKGPGVMDGYHNLPEETAKTLTEDGWLRTGDNGALDADGYLRITGRKKDLFKTSGGKYIAPPAIESKFKAICPYASQFVVLRQRAQLLVALVTLDPDAIDGLGRRRTAWPATYAEIVASDAGEKMVAGYVDELNARLNRWETIKKWELLDHDLTVESGELTPSMKVKRNVVEDNYKDRDRRPLRLGHRHADHAHCRRRGEPPTPVRDRRAMFEARLTRWCPDLVSGVESVYGAQRAPVVLDGLVELAARAYAARSDALHERDLERMLRPDWFQDPALVGYAAYAERFAGDLAGVAEQDRLPAASSVSATCT